MLLFAELQVGMKTLVRSKCAPESVGFAAGNGEMSRQEIVMIRKGPSRGLESSSFCGRRVSSGRRIRQFNTCGKGPRR